MANDIGIGILMVKEVEKLENQNVLAQQNQDGEGDIESLLQATIDWQEQALVGNALREYRESKGMTKARLAELMGDGCTEDDITQYEAGSIAMEFGVFFSMTHALGISPDAVRPERLCGRRVVQKGYAKLTEESRNAIDQIISILLAQQNTH